MRKKSKYKSPGLHELNKETNLSLNYSFTMKSDINIHSNMYIQINKHFFLNLCRIKALKINKEKHAFIIVSCELNK